MAGWTGLEPATFCVTGRRSNQLSYHPLKWHGRGESHPHKAVLETAALLMYHVRVNWWTRGESNPDSLNANQQCCHYHYEPNVKWCSRRDLNP